MRASTRPPYAGRREQLIVLDQLGQRYAAFWPVFFGGEVWQVALMQAAAVAGAEFEKDERKRAEWEAEHGYNR